MQQFVEKTVSNEGINIHMIPTEKYKTVSIVVKLRAPLGRQTITKRALVPYLLNQGTKNYPSEKELQSKLDELYGANLSIDGMKKGDSHIINFRLECANEVFIENETTILDEALELLHEIIFFPYLENNTFPNEVVAREKETLRNEIRAVVDDKMAYANMRLIDEMYKGDPYQLHVQGYEEDLKDLTAEHLYKHYKKMLTEDAMDIYVLGHFDGENIKGKIESLFVRTNVKPHEHVEANMIDRSDSVNEVIEVEPIQQAKLHIGYTTNSTFKDDNYFALQILNGLFGGFPSSKLFVNVREKNSLAYYAASRLESHKGLLIVFSGIEGENYEQARNIIALQMQALKDGDFTDNDLEETKELIISQLRETLDNPQGIIELLYQQVLGNKELPPEQFIKNISTVTKEDVVDVAQEVREHTIYLLKNESGEQVAT